MQHFSSLEKQNPGFTQFEILLMGHMHANKLDFQWNALRLNHNM